jgi:UDP-glucose 4-epimerase
MIVITGGAGYIGSYVARALRDVFIVDDLRTGHRDALDGVPHRVADIAEARLDWSRVEAVVHLAASTSVEESVRKPDAYRANNVVAAQRFLAPALERKIPIVFSSTAAVYGEPERTPIPEEHPTRPINPYGATKLELERWLLERGRCAVLRYFNAAGGNERHDPETHLIPRVRAGSGPFPIYGRDYPTPDGTCVRDFVHVEDLARAHVAAIGKHGVWNLGSGRGTSVLEVVTKAGRTPRFEPRRPGDPAILVADITRARRDLQWEPRRTLEEMLCP